MDAELKPNGGSKCPQLSIIFLLLNIFTFALPVEGFALKSCRISYNKALCDKNKLKSVPQDIPSSVIGCSLSVNKISRIHALDFKNIPALKQLDLDHNNISQIDAGGFSYLTSLEKLNLNYNKLAYLGENAFDGLSHLVELRISKNYIKEVAPTSFKSMESLRFLDISNNRLRCITKVHLLLQHLPQLRELYVRSNDFKTFQSWELTNTSLNLRYLDLSNNPIMAFRMNADVLPNLTWFKIGESKQPMKWEVSNGTFLSQVSTLDISGLRMTVNDTKSLLGAMNSSLTTLRMNRMKGYLSTLINISCTIPTMSELQLRDNKLGFIGSYTFKLCSNLTELDLSLNHIKNIHDDAFTSLQNLRILTLSRNRLPSVPAATRTIPALAELDLSTNNISALTCTDFANQTKLQRLSLYQNSFPTLKECLFKGLTKLQTLKMQTCQITKLNHAFKNHLPNLRSLHLNGNKLTIIKNREFEGLRSLQNLSLHQNEISQFEKESFIGLTNLTDLRLQINKIKREAIDTGAFNAMINLRRLDLRDNHIKYTDSSALSHPPFSSLSRLEELSIPGQHYRGRSLLPLNFLQGLTNLVLFDCRNTELITLHKDTFNYTPKLKVLNIASNEFSQLSVDLFLPIPKLKSLYISRTNLRSLDFFKDANLTNLEFLQSRKNTYSVISEEVIKSLPALVYLDLQGNSFTCDCDNSKFQDWVKNSTQTQVFDAYSFVCNYPPKLKNKKLLDFDTGQCLLDAGFICYVFTTSTVLCFMIMSFIYHFMRWQLVYGYYLFLAWLFDTKHKNKQATNQYDAFISYNTDDEPWVINKLLPKLEDEQGWKLCLHHRDFEPGKPIIDNITDAIYGSRKTICVISRKYLESEWCSREIQAASFRLFDEKKDVLILVFLEEIPDSQLSPYHRMRKLLKRQTYLSWPRAEEHTEVFWEKLRQALKTRDNQGEGQLLLSVVEAQ
ncbi:toll-like receptor 13 [Mugil cephalus]|uniref:toll-like receptor 13 n=1 Tax=Mugil cephalus TaxID=48193 RepID=UPI001FB58EE2|nr:toll-like receptor 13 [Mugil cephalus]XP_047423945.1 toll-like receptor 13 [Mugil cephalus]